jgi:hypothetical protein
VKLAPGQRLGAEMPDYRGAIAGALRKGRESFLVQPLWLV